MAAAASQTACAICQEDALEERAREEQLGGLDGCGHKFCFECVRAWSAEATCCPMCKAVATALLRYRAGSSEPVERIELQAADNRQAGFAAVADTQAEYDGLLECVACRGEADQDDDDAPALLCDVCNQCWHIACLPQAMQAASRVLYDAARAAEAEAESTGTRVAATPDWPCPDCGTNGHGATVEEAALGVSALELDAATPAALSAPPPPPPLPPPSRDAGPATAPVAALPPRAVRPVASAGPSRPPPRTRATPRPAVASTPVVIGDELRAVLDTELRAGQLMTIEAVAGAGKSTALREYAAHRPSQKILFLAFNTLVQEEMERAFAARGMTHVTVRTLHALACAHTHDVQRGGVWWTRWSSRRSCWRA